MYAPRVQETSTATGTGNFTLAGAVAGMRTFNLAFGTVRSFTYAIVDRTTNEWEQGIGYLSNSTTLVRQTVISSSNGGALVSFAVGTTKDVFNHLPPEFVGNGMQAIAHPAARMHFGV